MRWLAVTSLVLSCVSPGGSATDTDTDTATGPPEGPPEVWDLGTSVLRLTEGESVTFTAFVQDPDGPDDIEGVSLESPDGLDHGVLAPDGSGRFTLTLTWAELHAIDPIDFEGELVRTFVARAVDRDGHEASASTNLTLACLAITPAACDGVCIDLDVESCP